MGSDVTDANGEATFTYLGIAQGVDQIRASFVNSQGVTVLSNTVTKDWIAFVAFCFGDGTAGPCPCANNGSLGNGCANSTNSAGANLSATGSASVTPGNDSVVLIAAGQNLNKFSVFVQSSTEVAPIFSGDGRLCLGTLLRMYTVTNPSGFPVTTTSAPDPSSDPSDPITVRSAALGDPITPGSSRNYQVFYRNPDESFCPFPMGNNWNLTNALRVIWSL